MRSTPFPAALALAFLFALVSRAAADPGLLFHLSGDAGTTADFSAGNTPKPTYEAEITKIADGARGGALECGDTQLLAYRAPGNIYAQRGTLSFFWRSRYAVGPTPFPLFRVGYADHSSWDMTWLRIDYNGHGFDAFVTDVNLARSRVSVTVDPFPAPKSWTHLTLAWDETHGVRFYVNGKLAAHLDLSARYDAALDQFGPHSRIISPYQVQSDYNFVRGGDIDEVRIYDRMLDESVVATLAKSDAPKMLAPTAARSLSDPQTREEWWFRYGFNRPNDPPPPLPEGRNVSVRKVEIHDAYDLKRWWWKATDGIRETTWPGVYNRSRLPGRNDYFQLPDWDCYVESGKAITFALPDEPVNHVEISGAAFGKMELLPANTNLENASGARAESILFERPRGQEKTIHALNTPLRGRQIRFTNVEQEQPIGELAAYNMTAGNEPAGSTRLAFVLQPGVSENPSVANLQRFIHDRFASDERATLIASTTDSGSNTESAPPTRGLPLVHILIPDTWDQLTDGLDGIAIDLPALKTKPTHGGFVALNVQVKDPLWPLRDMLDFTFGVKPGEAKTLWLDLRDRILPAGKGIWMSIAAAGDDFDLTSLRGAHLRLVFKSREAARAEHELDRFTQARDSYAMLVEEHPNNPRLDLWNRFKGDLDDLLRVNPDHVLGRQYAAAAVFGSSRLPFKQPEAPAGVPLWAFRQVELLRATEHFVLWYIDHRQVEYGDFGGGISDDTDLTNLWPGLVLMGSEPEKIRRSVRTLLEAAYKNGMFTHGLPTIQADELHSYEEGINCLAQNLILNYGNPQLLERAMETARGIEGVTGINAAGHRHIRSSYYSGSKIATDDPWGWSKPYSNLVLQVPQLLVDYNGAPAAKKYLVELADGFIAHRRADTDGRFFTPATIHFASDREGRATRGTSPWHVFWGPWLWTHDRRYLEPLLDGGNAAVTQINANAIDWLDVRKDFGTAIARRENGPGDTRPGGRANNFRGSANEHFAWQVTGDKSHLERLYATQIETCAQMDYINTEGSLWIDRVGVPTAELQRARLGGVALVRNSLYPGHVASWAFAAPATARSVAILIPNATPTAFTVIAYNLEETPVRATMTGWNIEPGTWEITQGVDTNNDDEADSGNTARSAGFERGGSLELTLPPRATTILTLKLKSPAKPYWQRPDVGISSEDVSVRDRSVRVRVHSLGGIAAIATTLAVRDSSGRMLASTTVPPLEAPADLLPKTVEVSLELPVGTTPQGCTVTLDPEHKLDEITTNNNSVTL